MLMAVQAAKYLIILGGGMANFAATPDSGVPAGKNREEGIMLRKVGWSPACQKMAILTAFLESHLQMRGAGGLLEIGPVA
jgi:hypothetical protein